MFSDELKFEEALVTLLTKEKGWSEKTLRFPTEKDLIKNWANILFENNRGIDRLGDWPLTEGEMQQILEQINRLRTPVNLNGFINGKTIAIKRDNPNDVDHFGKEVSLKIYDRMEIAAGSSRYQIAEQPIFSARTPLLNRRRGDLMLLINGMPVIHIELKKSGIDISQACHQIEKYSYEGVFTGLFSLVQIFVAMTPEETVYFANPGTGVKFNKNYFFHWADFYNTPVNKWEDIATHLLSIPMAHQLIGFYTVADDTDGVLKVMRSYQYFAASAISDRVSKLKWGEKDIHGGYVWHTTGSGKTMTSFKSAQLIANSKDADKVVFLVDRIELGTQSLQEYRGFADANEEVQATENTNVLIAKLKSNDPKNTLIVTSIQKMSRIKEESTNLNDIIAINMKRIVFIVDEAHQDTFGIMLETIKWTFPQAVFFGFTGTPILNENQKKQSTTAMIFGNELHRYSIADGIRDHNVLGFDPYKVLTYQDKEIRTAIALKKAKATSVKEAIEDQAKRKVYYRFIDPQQTPMVGYRDDKGKFHKGIEDYLKGVQYERDEHQDMVIQDIFDNWETLSRGGKFHALFATSSIFEAIQYYQKIKIRKPELKVAILFDATLDNMGRAIFKEEALKEIIEDYNRRYGQSFGLSSFDRYKKDISRRLAHKKPYIAIENTPEKTIDLLIVVDQMLMGFDSKWINTLYLDKILKYENVVQAFSRTNRLFGPDKPHGVIRYYRKPHTMEKLIEAAFKLYSGEKPFGIYVDNLEKNLKNMNEIFEKIKGLFLSSNIQNFDRLPDELESKAKFASLFKEFNQFLEAALIQGFQWKKNTYIFQTETIEMHLNETTYLILVLRYQELFSPGGQPPPEIPYEIQGYLTEINTAAIDVDYMNSRFRKYLKELQSSTPFQEQALNELHRTFGSLTQEDQKYANIFLHDVQRGEIIVEEGKTFRDYITEYRTRAKDSRIHRFAVSIGVDETMLQGFMNASVNAMNINEFGRFDKLISSANMDTVKKFLENKEGTPIPARKIPMKLDEMLRKFILEGGFEV